MRAIGLMSGTSMDGIDVALLETDGETEVRRLGFSSVAYDEAFRRRLREALVDAAGMTSRHERPGCVGDVERELTERHASAVHGFLAERDMTPSDIQLVSFHGQTVVHRPEQSLTVQLGNGALLAAMTGIDVVYDLRAADVAAGGQGAPLAPVYHRAMAAAVGGGSKAVLNIGGVANVTFISGNGGLVAFDTGPGNALIDDWVLSRGGVAFDVGGRISEAGTADETIVASLMRHSFFDEPAPKSLDRNHFSVKQLDPLSMEDGAATLAAFTIEAIALSGRFAPEMPGQWIVCGGGRHNPTIMRGLRMRLSGDVVAAEDAGFNGDAVEAEAWAYLGARSLLGKVITFPSTTGVKEAITGGEQVQSS